jgi:hypothetical protein
VLLIFGVSLKVHGPIGSVQVGHLQWNRVPPGINRALNGFGIPLHVNEDGNFLIGARVPFAVPGTGERMSFLRPRAYTQGKNTKPQDRSSAH